MTRHTTDESWTHGLTDDEIQHYIDSIEPTRTRTTSHQTIEYQRRPVEPLLTPMKIDLQQVSFDGNDGLLECIDRLLSRCRRSFNH